VPGHGPALSTPASARARRAITGQRSVNFGGQWDCPAVGYWPNKSKSESDKRASDWPGLNLNSDCNIIKWLIAGARYVTIICLFHQSTACCIHLFGPPIFSYLSLSLSIIMSLYSWKSITITNIWTILILLSVALFHFYPEYKKVVIAQGILYKSSDTISLIVSQDVCLNWGRVLKHGESYRCVTTFLCLGGKFGMHTILDIYFFSQVMVNDNQSFRFNLLFIMGAFITGWTAIRAWFWRVAVFHFLGSVRRNNAVHWSLAS
jgi:hypothetical protein